MRFPHLARDAVVGAVSISLLTVLFLNPHQPFLMLVDISSMSLGGLLVLQLRMHHFALVALGLLPRWHCQTGGAHGNNEHEEQSTSVEQTHRTTFHVIRWVTPLAGAWMIVVTL